MFEAMYPMGLLISCATPADNWPKAAIFSDCTNLLFSSIGAKVDQDNDEPVAYLLSWLVKEVTLQYFKFKEKEPNLTGEDIREGIVAIVSVRLPQPQFEGQTKGKLGSQEVEGVVNRLFSEAVTEYFEKNPSIVKTIAERALRAAKARAAAKKVPMRSKKAGKKTAKRLKINNEILKQFKWLN